MHDVVADSSSPQRREVSDAVQGLLKAASKAAYFGDTGRAVERRTDALRTVVDYVEEHPDAFEPPVAIAVQATHSHEFVQGVDRIGTQVEPAALSNHYRFARERCEAALRHWLGWRSVDRSLASHGQRAERLSQE